MINCALIGYGYWGPNVARSLIKLGKVSLVAICDQDKNKLEQAKNLYPQAYMTDSLDQVLNDPKIDAVIIATPANTHFTVACKSLQNNKHILVEKPLTLSSEEVKELKRINEQKNKIVMVGHTFEFNPAIRKIKQIINDESFGRVYYIYSIRVNLGQIRGDINALWNLAPHDISISNYLLGSIPQEVMAIGASFLQTNIEDVVFAILKYPDNILVEIHVSWLDPAKERQLTVIGSKKMLVFNDLNNEMPLKIYDKRADTGEVAKGLSGEYKIKLHSGDIYAPQVEGKEPLMEELSHFFECIEKKQKPSTDIDNGLNVVRVLEACQESLREGNKWIRI